MDARSARVMALLVRHDAASRGETYPDALHVVDYEQRYDLPVVRPAWVEAVHRDGDRLRVGTDAGIGVVWLGAFPASSSSMSTVA